MKTRKLLGAFILFLLMAGSVSAQDAVIIEDGNFVRGTIQGTDYSTVRLIQDDKSVSVYKAKDIKEFLWNGETYRSKPVVIKKRMEYRFFKAVVLGTVNLYAIGGESVAETDRPEKIKIRPSIGVGMGSGGYGGMGMGGGISFGGGRRQADRETSTRGRHVTYYIEKLGTGPMLSIPFDNGNSDNKTQQVKNILLQKLTNDEDLSERIKATESFDAKTVTAFVKAYNDMHKSPDDH